MLKSLNYPKESFDAVFSNAALHWMFDSHAVGAYSKKAVDLSLKWAEKVILAIYLQQWIV